MFTLPFIKIAGQGDNEFFEINKDPSWIKLSISCQKLITVLRLILININMFLGYKFNNYSLVEWIKIINKIFLFILTYWINFVYIRPNFTSSSKLKLKSLKFCYLTGSYDNILFYFLYKRFFLFFFVLIYLFLINYKEA